MLGAYKKTSIFLALIFTISLAFQTAHADPPTSFPPCNYGYRVDGNKVYFCNGDVEKIVWRMDGASFETIDSLDVAKDKRAVYCQGKIVSYDPKHFSAITDEGVTGYFKDSRRVYFEGCGPLKGSDPKTFKNIHGDFNRDKNHIYYQGVLLHAFSKSFVGLDGGYAKDKKWVYFTYKRVSGADPKTFEVRKVGDYSSYCGTGGVDSWDKSYYYMNGFRVCKKTAM